MSIHRAYSRHPVQRLATASVVTAIVTALTMGASPPPQANAAYTPTALAEALATTPGAPGLPPMALAPGAPDPASIPDLTFGIGPRGYDAIQTYGALLETAFLNNVNLAGVLERLGVDPETAINTALGNALVSALAGVALPVGSIPVIGGVLSNAGITNVAALLSLLGLDLDDPLGLTGPTPGLNVITTGPPFSLLKFAGIDLGWVPGFPNAVADEINGTQYLGISPVALLQTLKGLPGVTDADKLILDPLILTAQGIFGNASAIDVRVPVVIGFGLGAFAAGMAYPQVVADLANQPGGANDVGADPLAGSLTILPMILLRNPGRANGGLFARFYPVAGLAGIDTVTPDTAVTSSSDGTGLSIAVGNTGIVIGDANLVPIKVDGTVEYDPLSDFPAWPNPFSLANSAAALAFPTYLLRGITAASLTEVLDGQLKPQVAAALANTSGPLALNLYLTVPVNDALPLLEPVKLPIDLINLFTGANLNNPFATALEPVLTTLVNLGYTDVTRTVVDGVPVYDRTLDQGNVITPFGTLPSGVDWGRVPGDLLVQLAAGIQKAIGDGLVGSTPVVNPLGILANLLGLNLPGATGTSPLSGLTTLPGLAGATSTAAIADETPAVQARAAAPAAVAPVAPTTDPEPEPEPQLQAQAQESLADDDIETTSTDQTTEAGETTTPAATGTEASATRAQARLNAAHERAVQRLDEIAKDGRDQIAKVVGGVQDDVPKTVKPDSAPDPTKKTTEDKSTSDDKPKDTGGDDS